MAVWCPYFVFIQPVQTVQNVFLAKTNKDDTNCWLLLIVYLTTFKQKLKKIRPDLNLIEAVRDDGKNMRQKMALLLSGNTLKQSFS